MANNSESCVVYGRSYNTAMCTKVIRTVFVKNVLKEAKCLKKQIGQINE
jgi:hypothetical protein